MHRVLHLALIGFATLGAHTLPSSAAAADPIAIVAAENVYGDLATQIGGDLVRVSSIVSSPDDDPHLFESVPSTARALADAQVVIYNGADYDPWMDKLLSTAASGDRAVIVAADLSRHKAGDNPHIWYDPKTLPAVATALATELGKRDPADVPRFQANLKNFLDTFAALTTKAAEVKAEFGGTKVTATEPVFGYMSEAMGLEMLNLGFQLDMMNETEPSAGDVAAFEDSLRTRTAKILFYNNQVTDATTERLLQLAKQSGVAVVGVTETEPAGMTIQDWFGGQIAAVHNALTEQR